MKDGQAAIRVFVDPDARLDVVMAVAILWNLQHPVAIAHGIVIADDAILVDAEDVPQVTGEGHECRAPLVRYNGEAGVVGRQEHVLQKPVGRLHMRDAGQAQLLIRRPCKVPNIRSERPRAGRRP